MPDTDEYVYVTQGPDGVAAEERHITRAEILAEYWNYWCAAMTRVGKAHQIDEDLCVEDWCIVNWAAKEPTDD